jgi:hypothetical protein
MKKHKIVDYKFKFDDALDEDFEHLLNKAFVRVSWSSRCLYREKSINNMADQVAKKGQNQNESFLIDEVLKRWKQRRL